MAINCKFCDGEGEIYQAEINLTGETIYICDECDTVWLSPELRDIDAQSFENIMMDRGLNALWSELVEIKLFSGIPCNKK